MAEAPDGCAVGIILMGQCSSSISRATADSELALSRRVENASIAAASNTWPLDFENEICGKSTCSTVRGRVTQYRDSGHISVAMALALTGNFYRAIVAHAAPRKSD
jgi:hypothetical protein